MNDETKPKQTIKSLTAKMQEQSADSDERMEAIEETVSEMSEKVDTKFAELIETIKAMNMPRVIEKDGKHNVDYDAHETNQAVMFGDAKPGEDEFLVKSRFSSVHDAEFKEKAEQMKFDREMIQVRVAQSIEKFPDHTFTLGVNGRLILVVRGIKQWIPRCYAEVMARAKTSTYSNVEIRNERNELEVENDETKASRYLFQVTRDDSPYADQWLERIMNEAA